MWFIFALAVSWFNALYYVKNQDSKLKPTLFMVYRGFLAATAVVPLLVFCHYDFRWQFYAIVVAQGFAISFVDLQYFHAFRKFGAETVCTIKPLTVLLTFTLWLVIKPEMVEYYLATPLRSMTILTAICAIVFATAKYRAQPVGLKCFAQVFPLMFISALIDTSNKLIMEYSNGHLMSAVVWRVLIIGIIIGCINWIIARQHNIKNREILKWKNIRQGLFILLMVMSMITVNFSLYYAENPAYASSVIYLSIIWIMLINKIQSRNGKHKKYKHIAKRWIFTLLIATIILILSTT